MIKINENILEFFKSNTRQQVRIKINEGIIVDIISSLDGTKSIEEISDRYGVDIKQLKKLLNFLSNKGILNHIVPSDDFYKYTKYRRIINFLADYSTSHKHLVSMWNNIRSSTVVIVGLGAVGTWVACNLIQSGLENIVLMDNDIVEISNLHRQFGFKEKFIGEKKIDVLEKKLKEYEDISEKIFLEREW